MTYATETLIAETCCACGVFFGLGSGFREQRLSDGTNFYCPNGHPQHYTENVKSLLEKAREEARQERIRRQATRDLLDSEQRSHAATRGHLTRQKKRAAAGVCPCCKRTFKELARHMKSQHPEYVKEAKS